MTGRTDQVASLAMYENAMPTPRTASSPDTCRGERVIVEMPGLGRYRGGLASRKETSPGCPDRLLESEDLPYESPIVTKIPPPPADASRARANVPIRFEDVTQDGRFVLEALPNAIGPAIWRGILTKRPRPSEPC